MNPSAGSLHELRADLWGADVWKEMCEVAVFTTNKEDTKTHKDAQAKAQAAVARGQGHRRAVHRRPKAVSIGGGDRCGPTQSAALTRRAKAQRRDKAPLSSRAAGRRLQHQEFPIFPGATWGFSYATENKKTEVPIAAESAATTPTHSRGAVKFPTPGTGMPRPKGAPEPRGDTRPLTGYGHNTTTDRAKHA